MKTAKSKTGARLWVRLIRAHRTVKDVIVPCEAGNPFAALREATHTLDLSMPVWLPRHQSDWDHFRLSHFTQDHFLEKIDFDRMEIEYLAPDEERKPPKFTE